MRIPAARAQLINTPNPATKDPVSALRYPNAYGPAKPARLASALIVPTAIAALESLRISVGMAQNTGRNAMGTQMTLSNKTVITFELGRLIRHKNPAAPMNSGNAACQRLSRPLSECHPLNNIAKSATTYGTAPKKPTCRSENPDWFWRIVGNQKITLYPMKY